ncbi:phosphoglycolate phosphatase [Chitinivorax tropicus]|uniref:Phosphoglycolate phosphatase n=1 Tax=Chitinivorax tropicus TaxID=714531 RepID=A0A840MTY2_9PROT|nr:HAD-IA family hydrolase [Chitinivorax tropicus]MBB5019826.1 phosphoglycolate phosphatase [Chitinivorax tropicus]
MPKRYDLLVFDWDGTLMDSTMAIVRAIQHAFRDVGLDAPSDERAKHVIGLGLAEAMRHLDANLSQADHVAVVDAYRHHYLSQHAYIELFGGVADALVRYREQGFLLAVATGKSRQGLNRAMETVGVTHLFDVTRCADETFSKPHPAMLEQIMDVTGMQPSRTLMIGDTSHDLLLARNARADGFAVSYGAHPLDELEAHQPVGIAHTFAELDAWLMQNA